MYGDPGMIEEASAELNELLHGDGSPRPNLRSFAAAGVLTSNPGFVVRAASGAELQVTALCFPGNKNEETR